MNDYYDQKYFEKRDILAPYLAELIVNLAKKHQLKRILDVGCGTGRLVAYLNKQSFSTNKEGFLAYGCDISDKALKIARKINLKGKIAKASATKLPAEDDSFDLVLAISLIEHLTAKQTEIFLKETKRVLSPGGYIFLVTPNFTTPLRLIHGKNWYGFSDPTHINFYTPLNLARIIKKHGFVNLEFQFKLKYHQSFVAEFPMFFQNLPKLAKIILIYLFFSTPLSIIRNSFWVAAQKPPFFSK